MRCTGCGQENRPEAKYCGGCGTLLDATMPTTPTASGDGKRTSLAGRMWRAAKLESRLYTEMAFDPGANRQAAAVVAMTSLLSGLVSGASAAWRGTYLGYRTDPEWLLFPVVFLVSVASGLAMWLLVSLFAWWLGARVFWKKGPQFTRGAVLRATGFARVTGILYFLTYIPLTGMIFALVGGLWSIAADVIALRQSLSLSTGRAIFLFVAVGVPFFLVFLVLAVVYIVYLYSPWPPSLLSQL